MKIYILISKEDTDGNYRTQVSPYSSEGPAIEEMKSAYEQKLQELRFDASVQKDGHCCLLAECCAYIEHGEDYYSWDIEEHDLKSIFVK